MANSSGVTFRAVIISLILIPINCYWIMYTEMVWWAQFPTTMSLFFNVIFCLAVITPINLLFRKISPKLSLNQKELLVIYVMLCMASAVASHDNLQVLIPMIGHPFWFNTPENDMILAVAFGSFSSFWAYLHDVYKFGSGGSFAWQPYNRLQQWLTYPPPPDYMAVMFIGIGSIFTFFLMFMRMKFFWWPFHAVGYAVSGADDWCMNWLWASLIISTFAKWIILRQGGIKAHRRAIPFFLGLVLGEFVVGSIWSIIGLSLGIRTFPFKDW